MFCRVRDDIPVEAIFDTGAEGGNWVSKKLVIQLRLEEDVQDCPPQASTPTFLDASGHPIQASSYIDLSWHWLNKNKFRYRKWHVTRFWILSSDHIQVVFGADHIRDNKLLHFNDSATLSPLTANQPITFGKPDDRCATRGPAADF